MTDKMETDAHIDERLEAEAAAWFTRMHAGDVDQETRERFETWLHGDRAHKIAYREFEQVYRDLDFVAGEAGVNVDEALGRANTGWLHLFPDWIRKPRYGAGALAAGVLAVVLVVTGIVSMQMTAPTQVAAPSFATERAEIKELVLEDGSMVTLGAASRIETEFTDTARKVTLLDGEAFFEVTKDPNRPFFVAAQDTLVRVVGTKFDVKRSADIVHVSVLEGVVEVMKPNDMRETIETADTAAISKQVLTAGERVSAARRVALPQVRQVEQAEPGAWRLGRLAYEDASLAEIIADVNRYYDTPIKIASSDIGDLRSTIAFRTDDIEQVFAVMAAIHPIEVDRSQSGSVTLRRKR